VSRNSCPRIIFLWGSHFPRVPPGTPKTNLPGRDSPLRTQRLGHIYSYSGGDGFLLCVHTGESARRWSAIKDKLTPFCRLTQDGDDEGCLHLARLPTPDEAELIRDALGIRKRRKMSPEAKRKARAALERFRASLNEGFPAKDASKPRKGTQIAPEAAQG
jgi:hypothetical protein